MKNVLYRFHFPTSKFGKAITWFSSGPYSHMSIVCNGHEYEATFEGFVKHEITKFSKSDGDTDVFIVDPFEEEIASRVLDRWVGQPYDFGGVKRFVFPWHNFKRRGLYCSEAGYKLAREMGWLDYVKKKEIDPTDLAIMIAQKDKNKLD